jgi:sulfite exporter TauE/SafE
MTPVTFFGVALASLAGSLHCAAMCGGFVAAYASTGDGSSASRARAHALYNGGRLTAYTALGAMAGALGGALDLAGRAAGVAHVAAIATGSLLLLTGVAGLVPRPKVVRLRRRAPRPIARRVTALLASFRDKPPTVRAALLGLCSALLPCGWLYAFAALAASTGSALNGAWLMTAFWLGSLPMLLGMGLSLHTIAKRFWARLPRLRPVLVLGVGVITLLSRFQVPAFAAPLGAPPAVGRSPSSLPKSADCPCHQQHGVLSSGITTEQPREPTP